MLGEPPIFGASLRAERGAGRNPRVAGFAHWQVSSVLPALLSKQSPGLPSAFAISASALVQARQILPKIGHSLEHLQLGKQ
jgi:hypothetical protein